MVEKIDALDQQILEIISKNARVPFKDVATVCGLSRAAIHQRVAHLIETGVIVGSSYTINPKSLGYTTCTYVGIKLERASMYESVATQLAKIPEIVECHFTTGPYTMLIKLYSRDNEHLMELLNKGIQQIDGVNSTETLISLEQSFSRTAPICLPAASAKAKRASGCLPPSTRRFMRITRFLIAAARPSSRQNGHRKTGGPSLHDDSSR